MEWSGLPAGTAEPLRARLAPYGGAGATRGPVGFESPLLFSCSSSSSSPGLAAVPWVRSEPEALGLGGGHRGLSVLGCAQPLPPGSTGTGRGGTVPALTSWGCLVPPPWWSPGFSPLCRAVWGPWVPAGAGLRCSEGLSHSPWCSPAQKILPRAFLRGGRASSLPCCGETEARHSERIAWGFPGAHGAAPEPSLCAKFGQILPLGASHPPAIPPHTHQRGGS